MPWLLRPASPVRFALASRRIAGTAARTLTVFPVALTRQPVPTPIAESASSRRSKSSRLKPDAMNVHSRVSRIAVLHITS